MRPGRTNAGIEQAVASVMRRFLFRYQIDWLADPSRMKIALKSRQIGFSEVIVWEMLLEALANPRRKIFVVSVNLKAAKAILERVADRAELLRDAGINVGLTHALKESLTFYNGSRIEALPCKASSVRGVSGSLYLDEFAFYVGDTAIWTALQPIISRGVGTAHALRVRIVSTPWGRHNEYFRLWDRAKGWSRHKVDLHKAVAAGHPVDPDALRPGYTAAAWAQEFLCSFDAAAGMYFPPSLLRRCTIARPPNLEGRILTGIDLASLVDNTSLVDLAERRSLRTGRDVVEVVGCQAHAGMPYPDQVDLFGHHVEEVGPERLVVDAGGAGVPVTQYLELEHGELVDGQHMHNAWQVAVVESIKLALEQGRMALLADEGFLRDFAAVEQVPTANNRKSYKIKRTKQGHGDRFWALALAWSRTSLYAGPEQPRIQRVELPQGPGEKLPTYTYLDEW